MALNAPFSRVIMIGGSAGSLPVVMDLLLQLPSSFPAVIIIVLHRLKNSASDMDLLLTKYCAVPVKEPEDKLLLQDGMVLLVPQNYHLLAEDDGSVSLDYSEPELNSRPSINICFESFAQVYGPAVTGIILSGSNNDGASGLKAILEHGGTGYVQSPAESEYPVMPESALFMCPAAKSNPVEELLRMFKMWLT